VLAIIAVLVIRFTPPERPWLGQVVMIGSTLIVASPNYAWYTLLLVPFIAMSGRWEWMLIPLALSLHAVVSGNEFFRDSLLVATVGIVAATLVRVRRRRVLADRTPLPQGGTS
jgi:hypothetical protein